MTFHSGRHFLQLPGPTNVPERVLHAISHATMDHRGPAAPGLLFTCLEGLKTVFGTSGEVAIFPSSGTGAWEAALVNTLNPGDRVVAFENGHFATLWANMAASLDLDVDLIPGDWRRAPDPATLRARLEADTEHRIKAVMVVHNETSTGVRNDIRAMRRVLDAASHPALLMADTISSLASTEYRHDEWGVDVAIGGSQKGLMLPPGLGFNAMSEKALAASKESRFPKSYWSWAEMKESNRKGFFPYTPATNLLYGLRESLKMLIEEEGLENVYRRHQRLGEATRRAVRVWGLGIYAQNESECSNSLTAVMMPPGVNEAEVRDVILKNFDMSLGAGLGKVAGKVFRIGHLGSLNDLMLAGALCGVEMGLELAGIEFRRGGVGEALKFLASEASKTGVSASVAVL